MNRPKRRNRAWEHGFDSAARGLPVTANPYRRQGLKVAWERGWKSAEKYAQRLLAAKEKGEGREVLVPEPEKVLVPE